MRELPFLLCWQQDQEPEMEALTRLVSESLARHGFDRPLDYRRLQWSPWLRCQSHHSLLFVPSKPGVFALAEEIAPAGADAHARPVEPRSADSVSEARRMLALTQFFEADDMAFVLDRMLSRYNPMRGRLESGRYFIRFVIIEDESQRRGIYTALNQRTHAPAERTCGVGQDFAASLELTSASEPVAATDDWQANLFGSAEMGRVIFSAQAVESGSANGVTATPPAADAKGSATPVAAPQKSSAGAATHIQRPPVFPSGF
jgi:hypothetical protein